MGILRLYILPADSNLLSYVTGITWILYVQTDLINEPYFHVVHVNQSVNMCKPFLPGHQITNLDLD